MSFGLTSLGFPGFSRTKGGGGGLIWAKDIVASCGLLVLEAHNVIITLGRFEA